MSLEELFDFINTMWVEKNIRVSILCAPFGRGLLEIEFLKYVEDGAYKLTKIFDTTTQREYLREFLKGMSEEFFNDCNKYLDEEG